MPTPIATLSLSLFIYLSTQGVYQNYNTYLMTQE